MRTARIGLALVAVVVGTLAAAPSSPAATTLGDQCVAEGVAGDITIVELARTEPGAVIAAPFAGVITRWQVNLPDDFGGALPYWLKILRPTAGNGFSVVDEEPGVFKAHESHQTRIPVQQGDRIGLGSDGLVPVCLGNPADVVGYAEGNLPIDSSSGFTTNEGARLPLTATLEPDADGDGWGDETQDQCPRSAEVLVACPALGLDTYAVQTKGYVRVYAAVYGAGKASIAFAGSTKIPASASDTGRSAKVTWKGSRAGTEGQFTSVRLKFSKNLIDALRRPGVSLPIKIKVTATNVAGLKTTKTLKVRVR